MINIYSLFYSDKFSTQKTIVNSHKDTKDPTDVYLKNAFVLQQSLNANGFGHQVLTNDGDIFDKFSKNYGRQISYIELPFSWKIPRDIKFYGAHFKLEVFQHLGTGLFGEKILFIDLDMIASPSFRDMAKILESLQSEVIVYYDVSKIEFSDDLAIKHMSAIEFLSERDCNRKFWAGGEFIFASAPGYKVLSECCVELMPKYLDNYEVMPHVGDEMIMNAAINLVSNKYKCIDVDSLQMGNPVVRFWSAGTAKRLERFSSYTDVSLYHFPADKDFIARHFNDKYNFQGLIKMYRKSLLVKSILRHIFYVIKRIVVGTKRYAPRL